jgi:zearalenone synthase (highly reducing iterative type I polyketide synthase)
LLKNGRSGFSPSTTRYNAEAFQHPVGHGNRQNIIPTKGGYFLEQDPYVFDAAFFNITAAEAVALDPRQRIAMEVAYEALENAGLPLQRVAGTQTACFMGSSMSDYRDSVSRDFANAPKYHILGISDEMISNRISHFLDIHGPSATIQTACSSSLVATHLACQSLRSGESEMAIAGGVGLILSTDGTMHLNNLGFLNPEGHSRSFDEKASGYGRGEGCGVIVLKPLDKAIRDGNTIRAVIRASGVNSDGWTQGVTMPSGEAQASLIKYVYESNGLDYASTQFVEAHGTGTKAGDPIETGAIYRTIGLGASKTRSARKKLWIGSVKANIGHLEAAAGVASIIKGILALENALIPPNINFTRPNPSIPLGEWNMGVPTSLTPWPVAQTKRMSVSGFGMGGTNAHVVLEAVNHPKAVTSSTNGVLASQTGSKLFVFSSHDKAGFKRIGQALVDHLDKLGPAASSAEYLADLAHTLSTARSGLSWRSTCFAGDVTELREQLTTTLGENATRAPSKPPRIGFVFTGQGAQWARMGIELLERPVFRASVEKSASFLQDMGCDWDPITELARSQEESKLGVPEISQPICSVLQIALIDELRWWGITPSKVAGHSSGEIAAAYTLGALSHRDALAVAYFRGKASASLKHRTGGMMAVGCSREDAKRLITEAKIPVTVACVNSPSNVTLSGDSVHLEALKAVLDKQGIFARRLKVDVAYHSSYMHSCSSGYYASIEDMEYGIVVSNDDDDEGQKRPIMVSSVTGAEIDAEELGPYYWIRNLTSPVLFTDAIKELASPIGTENPKTKDVDVLVEIGPHSTLGGPIEQILSHYGIQNIAYVSVLTRGKSAVDTSLSLAAELFRHGVAIETSRVNGDYNCHLLTDLPPYPWNHSEPFRADSRIQREFVSRKFPTRSLLGAQLPKMEESEHVWRGFIRLDDEPWLRDHTVGNNTVFPGAGMVSIVLEAAQQLVDHGKTPHAFRLRDVSFLAAMTLPENVATEVTIHMRPHLLATSGSVPAAWWEFTLSSCSRPTGQLRNNCRGLISIAYKDSRSPHMAQEEARIEETRIADYRRTLLELPKACSKELFYDRMAKSALPYGPVFKGVESCHPGSGKTAYEVKIIDIGETFTKGKLERPFLIHAATLDAVFQGWLGSTCDSDSHGNFGFDKPLVPTSIAELEIAADIPGDVGYTMLGLCRSRRQTFNDFLADIHMFDEGLSKLLLSVVNFQTSEVEIEDATGPSAGNIIDIHPADMTSEVHWKYALDFLNPAEIGQAVRGLAASTTDERLIEVSRICPFALLRWSW